MPRGRFLSRDVSTSERLSNLRTDFARVLWSWCVPHTDRDGRLPGSSRVLRAAVVPMLDVTNDDVADAVAELVRCRLAVLYDSNGTKAIQLLKFEEHQTGMRYDREAPSKYGPAPDWVPPRSGPETTCGDDTASGQLQRKSGPGPTKEKGSEAKSREGKGDGSAACPSLAEVRETWEHFLSCRAKITKSNAPKWDDTRRKHIRARLRKYGLERVKAAVSAFLEPTSWYVGEGRIQPELVFRSNEQLEKHEGGTQQLPTPETRTPEVRLPPPRGSD